VRTDVLKTAPNPIFSLPDYAGFKKSLAGSECRLCPLSAGRTQIVVDRGNPASGVLIVGEAPGEKEDLSGRAFVGRAGRLLDAMMAERGFDTEKHALIANVAKCRPPKNRPPTPEEAAACLPYLRRQIELMQPRFMVLLGATALRHMLPEKKGFSMAGQAGSLFESPSYPGIRIAVFFHPAYILRDPRKAPLMREHIGRFVEAWKAA
jgi:DNA polymerase